MQSPINICHGSSSHLSGLGYRCATQCHFHILHSSLQGHIQRCTCFSLPYAKWLPSNSALHSTDEDTTCLFCNAAGATKGNVTKPDWAHVFLTVTEPLDPLSAQQEEETAAALRAACADLMTKHGGQLRRAAVAQWEVRLAAAEGAPAWRVVVASPTGNCHWEGSKGQTHASCWALEVGPYVKTWVCNSNDDGDENNQCNRIGTHNGTGRRSQSTE